MINRIISIGEDINTKSKQKYSENNIDIIFDVKDDNVLLKLNKYKKKKNLYNAKFRNKNIAIEFFIENFISANVISPDTVKVDVMNRVESIRALLTK